MLSYQSSTAGLFAGLGLGVLFGAPWLVASVWLFLRLPQDGSAAPSLGETALRRLGL
jgi:hypothetical protein